MGIDSPFCQRNPMWANYPFGTSGRKTISEKGCLVCSAARMIAYTIGEILTPWELTKALVAVAGFEQDLLMRHSKLAEIVPGVAFRERRSYTGPFPVAEAEEIAQFLSLGNGVLVQINFRGARAGKFSEHWLSVEAITPSPRLAPYAAWNCYDPWWGEIVEIGQYYSPYKRGLDYAVWGLALYEVV